MEIEFCSKEQQQLMEYLTPKLSEEELKHVAFLLTQHNLENYTVGFTKASIQSTHPFYTTQQCNNILDELDSMEYGWGILNDDLNELLYTPPAYVDYLKTLILEVFPKQIWIRLHELNIDTELTLPRLKYVGFLVHRDCLL